MKQVIQQIQHQIKEGLFTNEASVIRGIINPILQELNWPINDVRIVRPEYTIGTQRVDIALFHNNQPYIYLEAKKLGGADGAEKQLFEYAFHSGVPILILTDGSTWHFFLTAGLGSYEERKVSKLDLIEYEDLEQLCYKFKNYLEYKNVISGRAQSILQEEYEDGYRKRIIERTFPNAWKKLIDERDDLLFEIFANKVEELCNFKPSKVSVFEYLQKLNLPNESPPSEEPNGAKINITPPGSLRFTQILSCRFGGTELSNRWSNLIKTGIIIAVKKGYTIDELLKFTTINLVKGVKQDRGFSFIPEVGLSYQGMNADKTWENALKLAQLTKQEIYVKFVWTNNPNAHSPGKEEILFWEP